MKNRIIKITTIAPLLLLLLGVVSCHRSTDNNNNANCPGTVVATYKVDGVSYQVSSYGEVTSDFTTSFNVTLAACVSDGVDKSISFEGLSAPPTVGSYPIRWKMLHAQPPNGSPGADYLIENGESFFTDSTTSTGTFTVTSVDASNKKFSGGFTFNATSDAGATVHITDGTLMNIPY